MGAGAAASSIMIFRREALQLVALGQVVVVWSRKLGFGGVMGLLLSQHSWGVVQGHAEGSAGLAKL